MCGMNPPGTARAKARKIIGSSIFTCPEKLRNTSGGGEERLTFPVLAADSEASLVNCDRGGITLPAAAPGALHLAALTTGSHRCRGLHPGIGWVDFHPRPRVCLHNIIANASPISPAGPSGFSFSPPRRHTSLLQCPALESFSPSTDTNPLAPLYPSTNNPASAQTNLLLIGERN